MQGCQCPQMAKNYTLNFEHVQLWKLQDCRNSTKLFKLKKTSNSSVPPVEIVLRPKVDYAETQERHAD